MFKRKKNREENLQTRIELVLLHSTNNEVELQVLKSLLDDNNIPYVIKDQGPGSYMRILTGGSVYGTEIYIEKSQLEEALRIIGELQWGGGEE